MTFSKQDREEAMARESAFRRGYQHGAQAAMDLIIFSLENNVSLDDVRGMAMLYENRLSHWRTGIGENSDVPPTNQRDILLQAWRDYQAKKATEQEEG